MSALQRPRLADRLLDSVLVIGASGTVAYYGVQRFSTSASLLAIVWFALAIATRIAMRRAFGKAWSGESALTDTEVGNMSNVPSLRLKRNLSWLGLGMAAVAYLFINKDLPALSRESWAMIILGLVFIGGLFGFSSITEKLGARLRPTPFRAYPWLVGSFSGLVALATLRPQSDDTNYVNISTWIAERGTLPTADTIFSDQVFPTKPIGSAWEPLWGTLAHLTHISAPTLLYVLGVPVLTLISVLSVDRALRVFHVRHVNFALSITALFLLLDGRNIFSFGVFNGVRIWQGKSFFVSALLPLVIAAGVAWATRGRQVDAARFVLATVAAAGATTSSAFLLPIVIAVVAVVIARSVSVNHALVALSGMLVPIYVGLNFRSAQDDDSAFGISSNTLAVIHPVRFVTSLADGTGPTAEEFLRWMSKPSLHAALFALVMCWGWLGLENKAGRQIVAGLGAAWAFVLFPPVLTQILSATHTESVAWRFWWLLPIPLLVGAAASAVVSGTVRLTQSNRLRWSSTALGLVLLFALMTLPSRPVWSSSLGQDNGQFARLAWPPTWKVFGGYYDAKLILDDIAQDGDIVAARSNIEKSLAATTVRIHPVLPKVNWFKGIAGKNPEAHFEDRLQIRQFTSVQPDPLLPPLDMTQFPGALQRVGVDVVCLDADRPADIDLVKSWGYTDGERIEKLGTGKGQWCARYAE